jgi:MFS family permease
MLINIRPLFKYRDYRLLYIGQFVSYFGNMLTYVALPYQIFHLTNSSLAVGNVGLVQLFPLLITSLWGGALADKLNRKKLLLAAEFGLFVASFFLLINTLFEPKLWAIYLLAGISSALNGFHRPVMEGILSPD